MLCCLNCNNEGSLLYIVWESRPKIEWNSFYPSYFIEPSIFFVKSLTTLSANINGVLMVSSSTRKEKRIYCYCGRWTFQFTPRSHKTLCHSNCCAVNFFFLKKVLWELLENKGLDWDKQPCSRFMTFLHFFCFAGTYPSSLVVPWRKS